MSQTVALNQTKKKSSPVSPKNQKEIYYPTEEPKKLGETDFQHHQIYNLEGMLRVFFSERKDIYISSDIIFYYEEGNPNKRFAPELMVCFGLRNEMRRTYKLWEEKVVPSIIIEIASKETWEKDVTAKRRLYEKLGVQEYYVFDSEYKYLPQPLFAYRLEFGELVRQSVSENRIFSPILGLELVDNGKQLRLFNPDTKEFLLTNLELAEEVARLKEQLKNK
jgi:Uma2 family endonuclease